MARANVIFVSNIYGFPIAIEGREWMVYKSTHVRVLVLYKLKEGRHIWPSKMVDGLQARKHTPVGDSLKVILTDILEEKKKMCETFMQCKHIFWDQTL